MTVTLIPVDDGPQRRASGPTAPRLMTAGTLRGSKVMNQQSETLGEIDDAVFDVSRGAIAYVVLASGGLLGLGERRFAVPWSALTHDAGRACFLLNAQKESFEHAPVIDKNGWPTDAGVQWHEQVHRHYGASLFFERWQ